MSMEGQRRSKGQVQQRRSNGQIQQSRSEGQVQQRRSNGQVQQRRSEGQVQQRRSNEQVQQRRGNGQIQQGRSNGQVQQRRSRRQIQQRGRRRRCMQRSCKLCLAIILTGLFIAAMKWYDNAELRISAGQAGAADNGQMNGWVQTQDGVEYPESLLALLELNPEAESFVRGYFENRDKHPEIDLSDEVIQGTVPLFLQWDERWGYETYGSDFLAITGCGPTCLSMVWCGLSGGTEWNPLLTAQFAEQGGYYVQGIGTAWDLMTYGAAELGLTVDEVIFDADHILAWLRSGSPIICSMRPGDFTTTGHFIVLTGVDEYGRITVCDPNSRNNSEKTWDVEKLIPQIKNLWGYRYKVT